MARVVSFSVDDDLDLGALVERAGYRNRSRFLRDAAQHYADAIERGDLASLPDETDVEGTLVIYHQHTAERRLPDLRHSDGIDLRSSTHACMTGSHTCVDTMHIAGHAGQIQEAVAGLRRLEGVDRVIFVAAPTRSSGCC